MAKKIVHQLVDDLDGTVLEPGEGRTVTFALDGKTYEIDLKEENAEKVQEALAPFIAAGRRTMTSIARPQRARRKSGGGRDLQAVRGWARENGFEVSDRGRVPEHILQAYDAAN